MYKTHKLSFVPLAVIALGFVLFGIVRPSFVPTPKAEPPKVVSTALATPASGARATSTGQLSGLDVSHFQGNVDWKQVAQNGKKFAFAKATEGHSYVDPKYARNAKQAAANGIPFSGYHFYRPAVDPVVQAKHYLKTVNISAGMLPPVIDVEIAPAKGTDIAAGVVAWTTYVEKATGCKPVVYASKSFWEEHLAAQLTDHPIWLAEYRNSVKLPRGAKNWTFWQYTDKGQVPGINGTVDLSYFNGEEDTLRALLCR